MKFIFYSLFFFFLILSGCKENNEILAEELCVCMRETGMKNGVKNFKFIKEVYEEDCFINFKNELISQLKDLSQKEKAEYMKGFTKALLKTHCGEMAFGFIPYDKLLKSLKQTLNENPMASEIFQENPTLCDCVNLQPNANARMKNMCIEFRNKWEKKYRNSSESIKKSMANEILECERKDN